jgi:hypothetical protein
MNPQSLDAKGETLAAELKRLVGEYQDDDAGDATKAEAWNYIADFTVENAATIVSALSAIQAGEPTGREAEELEQLRNYAHAATVAITNLTAGGSEYFGRKIGDLYTADLDFCVARIRESRDAANERWKEARREVAALKKMTEERQ